MAEPADRSDKLNVFISYSRDDIEFADQVEAALAATGFAPTIDRHGISGGEDWETRLGTLIRDADTVVFVLSPSSAVSKVCAWEVKEAVRLGKRILPILCRPLDGVAAPELLAKLNYVFFYPEADYPGSGFGSGFARLITALNSDLGWLREHTRYLQRATEWASGNRTTNRLLFGASIAEAKDWAARRPKDAPAPTELQLDYIRSSEEWETLQQSEQRKRLDEMAAAQAERAKALKSAEDAVRERGEAQAREAQTAKKVVRATVTGLVAALVLAAVAGFAYLDARRSRLLADANATRAEQQAEQARAAQAVAEAAKVDLKAKVDELKAANIRLTPSVKLRIAASAPNSPSQQIIKENWYKLATDGTRAVVVIKHKTIPNIPFSGTGVVVRGAALAAAWKDDVVMVTARHVATMNADTLDPSGIRAYFPGVDDKSEIQCDQVLLDSPADDIVVLRVTSPLPYGAIPIETVTKLPTAMEFAPLEAASAGPSLVLLSYIASGPDPRDPDGGKIDISGFQLGVTQTFKAATRTRFDGQPEDASASMLSYAYVTGGGAGGAPVFDANSGELLCIHQRGIRTATDGLPPHGSCGWLGGLRNLLKAPE